jgi:hypothetical protein
MLDQRLEDFGDGIQGFLGSHLKTAPNWGGITGLKALIGENGPAFLEVALVEETKRLICVRSAYHRKTFRELFDFHSFLLQNNKQHDGAILKKPHG